MKIYDIFFFQAEDGIRDYKVTGVQTCALPISLSPTWVGPPWKAIGTSAATCCPSSKARPRNRRCATSSPPCCRANARSDPPGFADCETRHVAHRLAAISVPGDSDCTTTMRSEERRVG